MSDDELVHQYDSGYRGKEYREEMNKRLGSTATGKSLKHNQSQLDNMKKTI